MCSKNVILEVIWPLYILINGKPFVLYETRIDTVKSVPMKCGEDMHVIIYKTGVVINGF